MPHSLKDPLLIKTKDAVETKLQDPLKTMVEQTVVAGLRLLYSPNTHQKLVVPIYEQIKARGFKPDEIANGMLNMMGVLFNASKGKMKAEAAIPAGVILLCYVLDDFEQIYGLKVTPELIKAVGQSMGKTFSNLPAQAGSAAPAPAPSPAAPPAPGGVAQQPVAQGAV